MAQFKLLICYKKTPGNEKTIAKIEKQIEILKGKKAYFMNIIWLQSQS